jgi:hypothetical protein
LYLLLPLSSPTFLLVPWVQTPLHLPHLPKYISRLPNSCEVYYSIPPPPRLHTSPPPSPPTNGKYQAPPPHARYYKPPFVGAILHTGRPALRCAMYQYQTTILTLCNVTPTRTRRIVNTVDIYYCMLCCIFTVQTHHLLFFSLSGWLF